MEEKDADNIRKVLCKSFIQWFWELNLCCYKYRVDYFGSLWSFFCCCWSESLERKQVSFVFPRVLMFPSTSSRETSEFYVEWQLGSTKRSILTFIMITGSELFDLGIETFTGAALSKWIVILLGKKITPMTVAIAKQKKIAKRRYRTLKYNIKKKT